MHPPVIRSAKLAAQTVNDLEPLGDEKNPMVAFILGFVFGPLGIALYFKSAKDFFICLGMLLFSMFIFGVGVIFGWFFSACYGAWRAHTSNVNLRAVQNS